MFVENDVKERYVKISTKKYADHVMISIHDNAGGIPDDIKLKIFEPYFTTKHKSQGTGIGLFMSKRIIEQNYNGTLQATNEDFYMGDTRYHGASFNIKIKTI